MLINIFQAIISWKRNEHPIGPTDKYEIRQNDTHSILIIKKVNENDHGNYTCVATNSIGMTKQNILITQSPSQPIITSEPIGHDKHFYWLSWHVHSAFPIQLYNLIYREVSVSLTWFVYSIIIHFVFMKVEWKWNWLEQN